MDNGLEMKRDYDLGRTLALWEPWIVSSSARLHFAMEVVDLIYRNNDKCRLHVGASLRRDVVYEGSGHVAAMSLINMAKGQVPSGVFCDGLATTLEGKLPSVGVRNEWEQMIARGIAEYRLFRG